MGQTPDISGFKRNETSLGKPATLRCHFIVAGRANARGAPTTRRGGRGTRDAVMGPWLERQASESRYRIVRQLLQSEMHTNRTPCTATQGATAGHTAHRPALPCHGHLGGGLDVTTSSARADSQPQAHGVRPFMWGVRSFLPRTESGFRAVSSHAEQTTSYT